MINTAQNLEKTGKNDLILWTMIFSPRIPSFLCQMKVSWLQAPCSTWFFNNFVFCHKYVKHGTYKFLKVICVSENSDHQL